MSPLSKSAAAPRSSVRAGEIDSVTPAPVRTLWVGLMTVEPATRDAEEAQTSHEALEVEGHQGQRDHQGDKACLVHLHLLHRLRSGHPVVPLRPCGTAERR